MVGGRRLGDFRCSTRLVGHELLTVVTVGFVVIVAATAQLNVVQPVLATKRPGVLDVSVLQKPRFIASVTLFIDEGTAIPVTLPDLAAKLGGIARVRLSVRRLAWRGLGDA